MQRLAVQKTAVELKKLQQQTQKPDFWSDNQSAGKVMQRITVLTEQTEPWLKLDKDVNELLNLSEMNDTSLAPEIEQQLQELTNVYDELKKQTRFNGLYDSRNAVLGIHAGAGGTDAQDWAQMLVRMYTRWAESNRN